MLKARSRETATKKASAPAGPAKAPVLASQRLNPVWQKFATASGSSPSEAAADSRGAPLPRRSQNWFEQRLGQDFSDVRLHSGPFADEMLGGLNALALTIGRQIAIRSDAGSLDSPRGKSVLAHELVHAAQQRFARGSLSSRTEPVAEREARRVAPSLMLPGPVPKLYAQASPTLMFLSSAEGQYASSGVGSIISDLSSPVVVGRRVSYQTDWSPTPGFVSPTGVGAVTYQYEWQIVDRTTSAVVAKGVTSQPASSLVFPRAGSFRVDCTLRNAGGATLGTLSLNQDAVAEDPWLKSNLPGDTDNNEAVTELVDDFRQYVIDAANSTGAQGITALLLASVLRLEIANTSTWPSFMRFSTNKDARMSELEDVQSEINSRASGGSVKVTDINKSVGVSQIRLSSAAMMQGDIPWTEQDPANRDPARAKIESDFNALSTTKMNNLLATLRWPKSNITMAANLLARLKNRANRYPTMARAAFGANVRACGIIATEYNLGASSSPEFSAQPSYYGKAVTDFMAEGVMTHYFPNT